MKLPSLNKTDPEFVERFETFVNFEVINEPGVELDAKTRDIAILASLIGCQGLDTFRVVLQEALSENTVTANEVKEIVYQAVAYLGIGRVYTFIAATNEVLSQLGFSLPLEEQETTTMENRLEKGTQAQVDIFGEGMRDFWKGGHINRWLAANCFGDYYTRKGLDLKQREMITLCFLVAQGGCEPQLMSHIGGNIRLGSDSQFLTSLVSQCLPYIGYPRSLNALACINKAAELSSCQ